MLATQLCRKLVQTWKHTHVLKATAHTKQHITHTNTHTHTHTQIPHYTTLNTYIHNYEHAQIGYKCTGKENITVSKKKAK